MQLLVAVGRHNESGSRLSELAKETGLHVATAHRLLSALTWDQMVSFDSYSKRYFLGLPLLELFDTGRQFGLRNQLHGALRRIAELTGDVVYLYLPMGNDILCADRVEGTFPVRALIRDVGARLPMGIGAGGLAILATLPDAQARGVVETNATRYREDHGLDADRVWQCVLNARRTGFGVNESMVLDDVTGLGMAVRNRSGAAVAAITVVSIASRMRGAHRRLVLAAIREAVDQAQPVV
jgi:DNA-binding IclR family transcriptional regulator